MPNLLLVGEDAALLEGLAQSLAALGYSLRVVPTVADAVEVAAAEAPLALVLDGALLERGGAEARAVAIAPGGAILLYHQGVESRAMIPAGLQRSVLADLHLPIERNRLVLLLQHITQRARTTGRRPVDGDGSQTLRA